MSTPSLFGFYDLCRVCNLCRASKCKMTIFVNELAPLYEENLLNQNDKLIMVFFLRFLISK